MSTPRSCLDAAPAFLIKEDDAKAIIGDQLATLVSEWAGVVKTPN